MGDRRWRDWKHFYMEVFGDPYMVWHDGADFTRLRALVAQDREVWWRC